MAERTLRKRRNSKLPVLLFRPSIIIGAINEPMPGWTDTISAAGGLSLVGGIGIVNYIHGHANNLADLIPVDIVSSSILVGTALQANKPELKLYHCSSSHRRPLTWGEFKNYTFEFLKIQPYQMQIFKPDIKFVQNQNMYKTKFFLKQELPVKIMEKLSKIPGIGTSNLKKNVKKGKMMISRAWETGLLFDHFTNNSWIFETKAVEEMYKQITPLDR
jgi:hypothetical protein